MTEYLTNLMSFIHHYFVRCASCRIRRDFITHTKRLRGMNSSSPSIVFALRFSGSFKKFDAVFALRILANV